MIVGWLISCVDVPAQLVVVSAQVFVDVRDVLGDVMFSNSDPTTSHIDPPVER